MQRFALFVSLVLVLLAAYCRGQEFELSDALNDASPTKKPTQTSKKPPSDDFDLTDALGGGADDSNKPAESPSNPGTHGGTGGGFDDKDLLGGKDLPPDSGTGGQDHKTTENAEGSQGMLAGIISSVVVAIAGAVSSFIAYQKKKLCFKPSDQENVNMESQQGAHAEPPVQRTLLQKQ